MPGGEDDRMLDGIEGAAAHDYFEQAMRFNKSRFEWTGRQKHPAVGPLNALLSLTYTLLTHELTGLLDGVGLDPHLGFPHQMDYGRPSLALDLVEAFRAPVADRLVPRGWSCEGGRRPGGLGRCRGAATLL